MQDNDAFYCQPGIAEAHEKGGVEGVAAGSVAPIASRCRISHAAGACLGERAGARQGAGLAHRTSRQWSRTRTWPPWWSARGGRPRPCRRIPATARRRGGPGFGGRSAGQAAIAIASNEAFSGWTKTFIDPRLYAAIVDRLALAGQIIIETGTQSYRLAQARAEKPRIGSSAVTTRKRCPTRLGRAWPNSWLELPYRPESPSPRWLWMKTHQGDPLPHSIR